MQTPQDPTQFPGCLDHTVSVLPEVIVILNLCKYRLTGSLLVGADLCVVLVDPQ